MNKEVKKKWTTALVSGQYKQVRGRIGSGKIIEGGNHKCMCVMGVLADLYCQETGKKIRQVTRHGNCTREVLEWAGLEDGTQGILINKNDGEYDIYGARIKYDFTQLANSIKKTL